MDQSEIVIQLFQLFLQFLVVITNSDNFDYVLNQTNQNYNYESDSEDYYSVDEEPTNRHDNYILINKFLYDNNINPQQFYLKFNEMDSINMVHEYEYPLNGWYC
ncbi:hypothetical protein F8M41_003548 [Gigaspora margarita]|uniref:Uncharacterized protein n=1 Tax=Gigaspora margarita TaxID=4874 RepID=A0A8H4AY85_GIGMA|nr:hypothetical protein F8M41_003548 [Gigaspora margarita]